MKKLKIAAEIYLWLIPILSVPLLYQVKRIFGENVFIVLVGIHLSLVTFSLGIFTNKETIETTEGKTRNNLVGILLILGALLTFIAATTFSGTSPDAVLANKFEHYWTSIGFLLAAFASLSGALFFTLLFKGKNKLAIISFFLYFIGSLFWIIHLVFRLTVLVWVAENTGSDVSILASYSMLGSFFTALYALYMILAYLAFSGFAHTVLKEGLLKGWLIKSCIIFNITAIILFASQIFAFGMPITAQLVPFLMGMLLLKNKKRPKKILNLINHRNKPIQTN